MGEPGSQTAPENTYGIRRLHIHHDQSAGRSLPWLGIGIGDGRHESGIPSSPPGWGGYSSGPNVHLQPWYIRGGHTRNVWATFRCWTCRSKFFYRFAEWFQRIVCRLYGISCDHFFDDFWLVSRAGLASHALGCLLETASLLGIIFDPEKTQYPSPKTEILGVIFDTSEILSAGIIHVRPKPSRIRNLSITIDESLKQNSLSSTQAASVVGKFGFLCSTMYGKVGRWQRLGCEPDSIGQGQRPLLISLSGHPWAWWKSSYITAHLGG